MTVGVYASTGYLDGRQRPRCFGDLSGHQIIGLRGRGADMEGVANAAPSVVVDTMRAKAIATRAGLGVATLPSFLGDHQPGLECLFQIETDEPVHLWLLVHRDLRQSARVRTFVDFVTERLEAEL